MITGANNKKEKFFLLGGCFNNDSCKKDSLFNNESHDELTFQIFGRQYYAMTVSFLFCGLCNKTKSNYKTTKIFYRGRRVLYIKIRNTI